MSNKTDPSDLNERLAVIEKIVEEKRKELNVPGAALVIVKDDKVIFLKGFGLRDVERELPVTTDTLFDVQSVTKPFTALAVMMSVDDGKMSLEDSPKKFLPFLKFRDSEIDANVTIRDLLCHRTGLANANLTWQTRALNRKEVIQVVALAKPTARLREQFQYNNAMYSVAGEALAAANNSTYEQVIKNRIFKPLNMKSSNLSVSELQKSPDFAFGYEFANVPGEVRKFPLYDYSNVAAAGSINSSVKDMAQFLRLMLNDGVIDGKRLVSEKNFKEMFTPQIKIGATGYWALGWASRGTWNGHRIVFHGGAQEGFNSIIALMPDQKLGFVLLTNISVSPLARGVVEDAIWTNLVGKRESESNSPTSNVSPSTDKKTQNSANFNAPISVDELMKKMTDATGGEANLRRHKSIVTNVALDYKQQGITGEGVFHNQSPNLLTRSITLLALGRKLGTIYEYFDGAKGGVETSFLPRRVFSGEQLQNLRIASDFHPLLNWKSLFKNVTIQNISKISGEDAYVVVKTPEKGSQITDYVSTKSFLLLRREVANGESESYGDYKTVNGMIMPFRIERNVPGIGNIVVTVKNVKFD
ncbi:MAG: beta-lactamase family protein [Acidobacteriota bacterium]|nr:beta-lactamase family protein [Acidobacteriota bacterium]